MAAVGPVPTLVCVDVDETIFNDHLHGELSEAGITPLQRLAQGDPADYFEQNTKPKTQAFLADPAKGLKNPYAMSQFLHDVVSAGDYVAFTTRSLYPEAITLGLIQLAGFLKPAQLQGLTPEKYVEQHYIMAAKFTGDRDAKTQQIQMAKDTLKGRGVNVQDKVLLIDDDHFNCRTAKDAGHSTVIVPRFICDMEDRSEDPLYIREARERWQKLSPNAPQPKSWVGAAWADIKSLWGGRNNSQADEEKVGKKARTRHSF